ncbi:NAD-dependent epimerase/dehydratase family protein [Saccharomonospora iraqiensis]|uniref:NAD-dependent epimerase/dehydratase family protein n=1 Tax=Saccharomonospora iraqiensis TaxID=52698 RepID=UPI00022E155E|nr:NAD-dependent epimerase/dehydratase family protein [Saccharomonospora iraqiensis]
MAETPSGTVRVVVVGATGNLGTSVVDALAADPRVESVVGVARRYPRWSRPELRISTLDLAAATDADVDAVLDGAHVVVHLAWLFQPTRDPVTTWRTNVLGAMRVFGSVVRCGVPTLVYSSSVAAYSPGPKDHPVGEDWPTHGWPGAAYPREKAYLERVLDVLERDHPETRVVRVRPGFVFQRASAQQQRRLFVGPFLPTSLVRPGVIPVVPDIPGLRFQAVHAADVGEAVRLAALSPVRGAFNLAADPPVDPRLLGELLDARTVAVPARLARGAVSTAWRMRAVPASAELFDTVLRIPVMDTSRARSELGWAPRYTSAGALGEFLTGLRDRAGAATPPLTPEVPGGRPGEAATGVGGRP